MQEVDWPGLILAAAFAQFAVIGVDGIELPEPVKSGEELNVDEIL